VDETEKGKAASENAPKRRHAAWWVEILIAVAVVLVVVGIAIPAFNISKTYARRGEAKANLHEIQLGIERFTMDTGGNYPKYLIGGSAQQEDNPKNPHEQASDPLLKGGYIAVYPRNPFAVPQDVKAMQEQYKDPFRPGTEQSKFGMRFGDDYTLMGQVLADFRYPKLPGQKMTKVNDLFCYADTEYPFWDIWPEGAKKPKPFLPGEFFYKSGSELFVGNSYDSPKEIDPKRPESFTPTSYMLGLYGAHNDRGMDVLGPESLLWFAGRRGEISVPMWTRSTTIPDQYMEFAGSPYGPFISDSAIAPFEYGSPNEIYDAIVLVLTPDGVLKIDEVPHHWDNSGPWPWKGGSDTMFTKAEGYQESLGKKEK
jgi:hypothetical protein